MIGTIAGAIFNNADRESIIAFHAAVDRVNSYQTKFELRPIFRNVTEWDSFVTEKIGMMPKLNMLSRLSSVIHKIYFYLLLLGQMRLFWEAGGDGEATESGRGS